MAFNLFEIGNHSGRPVSLYELTWGTTIWRYTSADRDVMFGGNSWTAVAISDDGVTQGGSASDFTVTCPVNLPVVDLFRSTPPAESIWLRCYRYHKDDPDSESIVYFVGTIGNVKRSIGQATIFGLPLGSTLRRTGLRLCWERNCPHMLYDQDCKADKTAFDNATTVSSLTGTTITVAGLGGYAGAQYNGGFIEWTPVGATAGTIERRGIEAWTGGNTFRLFGTTDRLAAAMNITMYLGCDLTPETCDGTFDNLPNHGGFKFMPGKSPFDGDQVF